MISINGNTETKEIEGTLVGRDDTHIRLSLKGRIVRIQRNQVVEVRLPKPKFENDDYEIRKLQE